MHCHRNSPIAYTESGLISIFPPPAFQHLKAFGRAAFVLRWWPAIVEKITVSSRGDRRRIPLQWSEVDHTKLAPLKDPGFD